MDTISKKFSGSALMEESGLKYAIYVMLIALIISVIVLVVDAFYPFLPINPISGPSAAARSGKTFWRKEGENLIVPVSESPTVLANNYMMSVQLMIGDSHVQKGQFRHIVHRGSNPCGLSTTVAGPSGHAGIQVSDIPNLDPAYKQTGLPSIMNPGLFLDKYKNDLHVFIHTKGKEGSMDVLWLESITVEDLPIQTGITIGVACTGSTLEVYLNCRLYSTLLLKGVPYLPPINNQWFGRYCAYPMSGLIKNLELWPTALGASDYMQMCKPASFSKNDLSMPNCDN